LAEGTVNCQEVIAASCRLLRPRLQKSELTLSVTLPDRMPLLQADARMVKQIILNLLANAVKFTQPGGSINVEVAANPEVGLIIDIRDTGVGIADANLKRVRQPFVQVDGSLNRRHEGTGLGLPLVDTMMRQHGGFLELSSQQGKGTTARIAFPTTRIIWPVADVADATANVDLPSRVIAPEKAIPPAAKPGRGLFNQPHLLVVEDDKYLCDLLCRMLERAQVSPP
jgi:signal transduction histidine kinase